MSYTKTTWNNLSDPPINAENLNKIEQGIYDNSIDITSINTLIGSSGTATTTQTDYTEGQLTQKLGLKYIKMKGQTGQDTYTGSQLVDFSTLSNSNTTNSFSGDVLTVSTSSGTYANAYKDITTLYKNNAGKVLRFDFTSITSNVTPTTRIVGLRVVTSGTTANHTLVDNNKAISTHTIPSDVSGVTSAILTIYANNTNTAVTNTLTINKPILHFGSTSVSYEPYVGGSASPSPSFPQDVKVVTGSNVIKICNKNLYDKDDSSVIFNGFVNGSTSKLVSNANARTICLPCKPNTTYTVSKTSSQRFITGQTTSSTISDGIAVTISASTASMASQSVTTTADAKYVLVFYYLSTADTLSEETIRNSIQVEIGSTATSFIAHQEKNYTINLGSIELCKINTYQDYLYKNNNKWFKHSTVGKKVFNGTETWNLDSTYSRFTIRDLITDYSMADRTASICSHYTYGDSSASNKFALSDSAYTILMHFPTTSTNTVALFQSWLASNNVSIYYPLATPTITEITYEPLLQQLDKLDKIGLYDISNISQDNSDMKMLLDFTICNDNYNGLREFIRA